MEGNIWLMLLLQAVLIGLNAVFASAEIAVISINDTKLERMAASGNKSAMLLEKLTSQPARFLATIQVAITLSGFLGSAFAADNFSESLVSWLVGLGVSIPVKTLDSIAVIVITLVLSYFTLVFGELVPKRVAMQNPEKTALGMASMIYGISRFFSPLVGLLTASTNGMLGLLGIDPNKEDEAVSEEDIRMMVDVGTEKGTIDNEEKEFIQNVFEFDDLTAGELATHRTDVLFLHTEQTMEQWQRIIHESSHSLFPVCSGNADNVIGVLNTKIYFRMDDLSRDNVMQKAVGPVYFVPETVMADVLLSNMKEARMKMAVVLDEYGGTEGIVTLNDLVEELVGDLHDDDGPAEEPLIKRIAADSWQINGDAPLDDVEKALGIVLPEGDYDTFNGYVFSVLGRIPEDGKSFELETNALIIHVSDVASHQIVGAVVNLKKKDADKELDA